MMMANDETLANPFPAILMAAGASRRFGKPKQLLRIGYPVQAPSQDESPGETLIDRTLRIALVAGNFPVYVVLGAHAREIERTAQLVGGTVLHNSDWSEGMASSIRCGMHALGEHNPMATGVLLLVCDQPALSCEHLQALRAAHCADPEKIVASFYAGHLGVPIIAPRNMFPALTKLEGDRGAQELLRVSKEGPVAVHFPHGEWDIDHPEDMREPAGGSM